MNGYMADGVTATQSHPMSRRANTNTTCGQYEGHLHLMASMIITSTSRVPNPRGTTWTMPVAMYQTTGRILYF